MIKLTVQSKDGNLIFTSEMEFRFCHQMLGNPMVKFLSFKDQQGREVAVNTHFIVCIEDMENLPTYSTG